MSDIAQLTTPMVPARESDRDAAGGATLASRDTFVQAVAERGNWLERQPIAHRLALLSAGQIVLAVLIAVLAWNGSWLALVALLAAIAFGGFKIFHALRGIGPRLASTHAAIAAIARGEFDFCLLYTSPSPRD